MTDPIAEAWAETVAAYRDVELNPASDEVVEIAVEPAPAPPASFVSPETKLATAPLAPKTMRDGTVINPPLDPLVPTEMTITEVPETRYHVPVYGPEGAVVFVVGATGSAKSIITQKWISQGTREGLTAAYFDGELPEIVAKSRMHRLGADLDRLLYFHRPDLDLGNPDHRRRILYAVLGVDIVVFDTLSSFFFAEEGDNPAFVRIYQTLLAPLADEGITVFVLDHSGVPSAHNQRRGVHAVRGQSSKAQKADLVIVAEGNGPRAFSLDLVKTSRYGMDEEETRTYYRVTDTADGGLDVVPEVQIAGQSRVVLEVAERMVEAINEAGADGITATDLQTQLGTRRGTYRAASALLELEEPVRVRQVRTARRSPSNGREYHAHRWFPAALTPVTVEEVES